MKRFSKPQLTILLAVFITIMIALLVFGCGSKSGKRPRIHADKVTYDISRNDTIIKVEVSSTKNRYNWLDSVVVVKNDTVFRKFVMYGKQYNNEILHCRPQHGNTLSR